MNIIADENIGLAAEAFEQFGNVQLMPGRAINRRDLLDVDALIVRSITQVNRELLEETSIGFVGTATIGTNHIDFEYLEEQGIQFADAAGGGARSVAEYVVAGFLALWKKNLITIDEDQVAVIGVGAIGTMIASFARRLGMTVIEYDPPRAEKEPEFISASLDQVFASDIVLLAVPLTHEGAHPTHHLVNRDVLYSMKQGSTLINVSRGSVVDSDALQESLIAGHIQNAILDVWEREPEVPVNLLERCVVTTPHIAGYSKDGKLKGTEMMAEGLAQFAGVNNQWSVQNALSTIAGKVTVEGLSRLKALYKAVNTAYDVQKDNFLFRESFSLSTEERKKKFDQFRRNYHVRREFTAWSVVTPENRVIAEIIKDLGFILV